MKHMSLFFNKDWTVAQVLESYPGAAKFLFREKTDCVGCRLAKFCSLEEVSRVYGLVLEDFLAGLRKAVSEIQHSDDQRRIP